MTRRALAGAVAAALVALGAAGCGGDKGPSSEATATPTATATPSLTDTSQRPVIAKPSGDPPARLQRKDIVKGTGPVARKGDQVSVQYVGASWSTGEEFDASWNRGQAFTFTLGAGQVIPGWDKGIVGMRVGGRRELIIPPDQGYGAAGSGPIGPNETLIFIVDLQKIG